MEFIRCKKVFFFFLLRVEFFKPRRLGGFYKIPLSIL